MYFLLSMFHLGVKFAIPHFAGSHTVPWNGLIIPRRGYMADYIATDFIHRKLFSFSGITPPPVGRSPSPGPCPGVPGSKASFSRSPGNAVPWPQPREGPCARSSAGSKASQRSGAAARLAAYPHAVTHPHHPLYACAAASAAQRRKAASVHKAPVSPHTPSARREEGNCTPWSQRFHSP